MTIALYDACVLYSNIVRDLLIRAALHGLVRAFWTDEILDEAFGNLLIRNPGVDPERIARTRELMNAAVLDVLVTGYEPLVDLIELPEPDDRHVLAAAVTAHADLIVTDNVRDFPPAALAPWGIEAMTADDFLVDVFDRDPDRLVEVVSEILGDRSGGGSTVDGVVAEMSKAGLVQLADLFRTGFR